jgi:hypothetical protein
LNLRRLALCHSGPPASAAARHCGRSRPVSAPRRAAPLAHAPSRTQQLPLGPRVIVPRLLAAHAQSHRVRAVAAHIAEPRPLAAPSPAPMQHRADPPPFPSPPCALSAFKSRRPPTSLPFSPFFFSVRSTRRCLPAPPPSLSVSSPVASPSHHRETEPPPTLTFCPLDEPGPPCVVACKWHVPHLLPSPPVLQDPATGAAVTGAPPPLWDSAAPPPLHPRTSSHCSGEPSPPPPHQAHHRRPHGAHTAVSGTPCSSQHAD